MYIVLTGSKGMIGSRLKDSLETKGYKLFCTDFDLSKPPYPEFSPPGYYLVIHAAGRKNGEASVLSRDNVLATQCLLDSLCLHDMCLGIIYISSIAIFGIYDEIITESSLPRPDTFYGFSKLICEDLIRSAMYKKLYIIVRPTNLIAPNVENVLGLIASLALQSGIFEAWESSLDTKRDYILVNDVVDILVELARRIIKGEIKSSIEINLCMGVSYSLMEVIEQVQLLTGKKLSLNITDSKAFRSKDLLVRSNSFAHLLGREPLNLRQAVKRIIAEFLTLNNNNKNKINPIN